MKEIPTWQFQGHPLLAGREVQAHTKSEARGKLKRELGWPRLPVGVFAVRKVVR